MRVRLVPTASLALLAAAGCGTEGSTDAEPPPGGGAAQLSLLAGEPLGDTVLALARSDLTIRLRDARGRPLAGVPVLVDSRPAVDPTRPAQPSAFLCPPTRSCELTSGDRIDAEVAVSLATDPRGLASIRVRRGIVPGEAGVAVSVPSLGLRDSVAYTVAPGGPARIIANVADTAVYAGGRYRLVAAAFDRRKNPCRERPVRLSSGRASVATVAADGVSRGDGHRPHPDRGVGRRLDDRVLRQRAAARGARRPRGATPRRVRRRGLRGRRHDGARRLGLPARAHHPQRRAVPGRLGAERARSPRARRHRRRAPRLRSRPVGERAAGDHGCRALQDRAARPVRPRRADGVLHGRAGDGAVHEPLSLARRAGRERRGPGPAPAVDSTDWRAAVSPDGTRLAYGTNRPGGGAFIRLLDLRTGAVTPLDVAGQSPAWSPAGDAIAYSAGGGVRLMRPDGTAQRGVTADGGYAEGVDWSADGRWLLARNQTTFRYELIALAGGR